MTPQGEPRPPAVRVADADRERVVALLQRHCADGRLDLDEFAERAGLVYAARTSAELERVTADLPVPVARTPETRRRRATRWVVGIMSGARRTGRWRPEERTTAVAVMGGCTLDLRAAEIEGPEIAVTAVAVMGGIDVIVPEGIEVELTGIAIMGGKQCRVKDVRPAPGTPIVRVRAFALMGSVMVRTKRERQRHRHGRHAARHGRAGPGIDAALGQARRAVEDANARAAAALERASRYSATGGEMVADAGPPPFDGTVTVLFSDIEDFTGLTERLGDLQAQEVLRDHNEIVRAQVKSQGGHEVKSQGDSFMVAFDGARRALRCAVGVQRALARDGDEHRDHPLRVRMGVHTGEAIREGDDLFGKTVIVASRIAAQASGGEVLVSSLLRELTESSGEFHFGAPREAVLKGIASPHVLYPVRWADGTP